MGLPTDNSDVNENLSFVKFDEVSMCIVIHCP